MSKQDELQYEQQEKRIQAQSDAFITLLTKRGILGDSRIDDAQKRAARQEKTKNCYQELICRGWFLPPNTYDCGSFVVNGTAVVGKESKIPYNRCKSHRKELFFYEIYI